MNSQDDIDGYTVAYEREELQFPVYVVVLTGIALMAWAFQKSNPYVFTLGSVAMCFAYHNFPLLETGRPRLGAGQYGLFVEGLGVIAWRAIADILLVPVTTRGAVQHELHITLNKPIASALIIDWRKRPLHRMMMRLPWVMNGQDIRINLEIFDRPPGEIHRNFMRLWQFFRA